jgi:electron transfer flavoprotein beta subunit
MQIAAYLAAAIRKLGDTGPVFMGKQAIDDDAYQTHIFLASFLECGAATGVLAFRYENGIMIVERDADGGGKEIIELGVPAVIAAAKGLNQPRYASMMGIMKAKKMEIMVIDPAQLGIEKPEKRAELVKLTVPAEKAAGKVINGDDAEAAARELLAFLKNEVKVL